jgi:hypothetical protein
MRKATTWIQHYWSVSPKPAGDGMLPKPEQTEWDAPNIVFPPADWVREQRYSRDGRLWIRVR